MLSFALLNDFYRSITSDLALPHFEEVHQEHRSTKQDIDDNNKQNQHLGQYKLLLSELLPLSFYHEYYDTVIYVGAAPGHHINYLADIFSDKHFILYDPCSGGGFQFSSELNKKTNVTVHRQYFTSQDAQDLRKQYPKDRFFYISDIRNSKIEELEEGNEIDELIKQDMQLQKEFYYDLNPDFSLLKFRLPWFETGKTSYLEGDIYYPIYAKPNTSESRLFIVGANVQEVEYSNEVYDKQMSYFNANIRRKFQFDLFASELTLHLHKQYANLKSSEKQLRQKIAESLQESPTNIGF